MWAALDKSATQSKDSRRTLRHGGSYASTGSKGRDNCCRMRFGGIIAALKRTVAESNPAGRISEARPQLVALGLHHPISVNGHATA